MAENVPQNLSMARNLKIALFHVGSGMADIMATGVWNRVMISDLGFSATPISLLASLRYFLAPLGVWAGRVSDERTVGGYRRLFWIWLGRAMMVISLFMLGWATATLAQGAEATLGMWAAMTAALLLFSLGNALSGSTFLALIYDVTPAPQRGRAVGIVWTFLLIGFTLGGILFGVLLPAGEEGDGLSFEPDRVLMLFVVAGVVLAALWFFSLLGEERRGTVISKAAEGEHTVSLRRDLRAVWHDPRLRFFMGYLGLSMLFAFAQDTILEPFAGDVFEMDVRTTTRFSAYWGSMSILGSFLFLWLSRKVKRLTNTNMSYIGVVVLIAGFVVFSLSALALVRPLVTVGLIVLGIGLGLWNNGTLGLMMDMSPAGRAGTFLGFWSLVVTFGRGLGVSSGGIIRDIGLQLTGDMQLAYGAVFVLEVVGLLVALWMLRRVRVDEFKAGQDIEQPEAAAVLAGAMD